MEQKDRRQENKKQGYSHQNRENRKFGHSTGHRAEPTRTHGPSGTSHPKPVAEETGMPARKVNRPSGRPNGQRTEFQRTHVPSGTPHPKPVAEETGMPARRVALKVIRAVTEDGAWAGTSLDEALRGSGLNGVDRRLATRLAYDTIDRLSYLDWALSKVMAREDTDIRLRNILRLGACQLLLEDRIPESAATNTSVILCTENGLDGLKGVCNGILRNLIRRKDEMEIPSGEEGEALRRGLPLWLWEALCADYGPEASAAAGGSGDEGWTIRPNLLKMSETDFEAMLSRKVWKSEKTELPFTWRVTGAMDIGLDADFRSGHFSIQTPGSIMACLAIAPKRGETILDCCAAPGGKSCFMAELMGGTGRVQAWDIHDHRVELIAAQARRLGLENVRPMARDATIPRADLEGRMDAVLLDAPCTGSGMMGEKPDIKLRLTEEGLKELVDLQGKLLDAVSPYVRSGGRMVYSTCSVLKDENERQIEAFLKRHPEFETGTLPNTIPSRYRELSGPGLQLLPGRDGTEGFYLCLLNRKSE